jgi:DNA-binding transcriptional LysR family regulator
MNTKQLEYFIAVAEELNFTRAAKKCYISQTAVTLQIQQLEEALGVQLFQRTNRRVAMTAAGKTFYGEARSILNHIKEAVEKTQLSAVGTRGTLVIGFIADYEQTKLVNLIQQFHQRYPNIQLRFQLGSSVSGLYGLLLHRDCDIIFNINFGLADSDYFRYRSIGASRLYAVLYPSHPLAYRTSLTRQELQDDLIILLNDQETEHEGFAHIIKEYAGTGYVPKTAYQTSDLRTLYLMIAAEEGIAILPEYAIHSMNRTNTLVAIPLEGPQEEVEIIAAWNKDKENPSLQTFLPFLEEWAAREK